MSRKRIRNHHAPSQNLDSFLDILTNTVGVLMFIGLFVSLLAVEAGTIIRTPLQSNTHKIGQFFEIRNNELFYLSDPQVEREIDRLLVNLPTCYRPNIPENIESYLDNFYLEETTKYQECQQRKYAKVQNFSYDTGHYIISFLNAKAVQYQPIDEAKGENKKDLKQSNSQFKTILNNLDPDLNYIAFIVRPDSFSTFRSARQQAWNEGFDVGWEPLSQNSPLVFGSGGRSIGVQ
jgi:hypothetical protein